MRFLALPVLFSLLTLGPVTGPLTAADESTEPDQAMTSKALSIEEIFADHKDTPAPSQVRWTTDGRLSYFLKAEGEDKGRDLWLMDSADGSKKILMSAGQLAKMAPSPEQATTNERERTRRSRFQVGAYTWSPDGKKILFSSSGSLLLHDLGTGETQPLAPRLEGVMDPKFSPDGQWIGFVYEHDIWIVSTSGGAPIQVTFGGHDLLLHGDIDWVYAEEFGVRSGFFFSPDSRHIAYMEMDQSLVPTYPIVDEVAWQATVDLQRYPKVGDTNPRVRIGVVNLEKAVEGPARTIWIDRAAEYMPRFQWADGGHVAVQLLDRHQENLELVSMAADTGRTRVLMTEKDPYWINITNDLTFLDNGDFLWTSHRSGLRHVYLYGGDGTLKKALTEGEFNVVGIEGVDRENGWVYFLSNEHNLLGRDLYRVRLDGTQKERVTEIDGYRRIDMNEESTAFLDSVSSLKEPGRRAIHHIASGKRIPMSESRDEREDYDLVEAEMKVLETKDGATVRMLLMKPETIEPGARLPVVVFAYGMAGFPVIRDAWLGGSRNLFHQFLVQQGYVVAYIDDRSSSIPGHKYAATADHNIGPVAAEDHGFAVEFLKTLPYVDPDRFGIWGWSGGGFTAAFHLTHTDLFKVGVAGAPPTDWRLYDSIYTERYMGLLDENPEAYDRTSPIFGAENLQGKLLLIHGTHDDNVHPQNTTKLAAALLEAGKQFDVMWYPNKTHGISGKTHRIHMYTLIFNYFEQHL